MPGSKEADEHFARLRAWGLTFFRFLITWEAVEHSGPGLYDMDYVHYVRALVRKAAGYGIFVFIDPHQDVWSRWTGGDGAPGWSLEAVGFNLSTIEKSGVAVTHQGHGDPLPKMIWGTNNWYLGTATMFTLFFAGNRFAPETMIEGEPVQDYLQRHYIDAMMVVATALKVDQSPPFPFSYASSFTRAKQWTQAHCFFTYYYPFPSFWTRVALHHTL